MKSFTLAILVAASALSLVAGCGSDGTTSSSSGGTSGTSGSSGTTGSCPFTLKANGTSYAAVSCEVQGLKTFAAGVYQIQISARFSSAPGPGPSVSFTITDDDDAPTATHVKKFDVTANKPNVNGTWDPALNDQYSTLVNTATVGTGSFSVSEFDRTAKTISGGFSMVLEKTTGGGEVAISGDLTKVPMKRAD